MSAKVLYVEDSIEYGYLMQIVLERSFGSDMQITWVTSRDSFLEVMLAGSEFDFLLCDGHIPGWCSPVDEVRSCFPNVPAALHTSSADNRVELIGGNLAFSKTSEGRESLVLYLRHVLNNFLGDDHGVARQSSGLLEEVLATQRKGLGRGDEVVGGS
jgi:CheY-like chemotaxis protein